LARWRICRRCAAESLNGRSGAPCSMITSSPRRDSCLFCHAIHLNC
jgi:hypothetical protein